MPLYRVPGRSRHIWPSEYDGEAQLGKMSRMLTIIRRNEVIHITGNMEQMPE